MRVLHHFMDGGLMLMRLAVRQRRGRRGEAACERENDAENAREWPMKHRVNIARRSTDWNPARIGRYRRSNRAAESPCRLACAVPEPQIESLSVVRTAAP